MTQLSAVLEDPSSLLCQRPVCKAPKRRSTFQTPTAGHFSQLYDEARKRSTRYTPEDLPCIGEETIEFADDLPQLLFQADEVFEEQREEEPPIDILETIQWRLQECDSIGLMEVAPSNARRDLARTFFAAMCLHNRGAIRLAQEVPGGEIRIAIGEA
jgi:hypothetical protein